MAESSDEHALLDTEMEGPISVETSASLSRRKGPNQGRSSGGEGEKEAQLEGRGRARAAASLKMPHPTKESQKRESKDVGSTGGAGRERNLETTSAFVGMERPRRKRKPPSHWSDGWEVEPEPVDGLNVLYAGDVIPPYFMGEVNQSQGRDLVEHQVLPKPSTKGRRTGSRLKRTNMSPLVFGPGKDQWSDWSETQLRTFAQGYGVKVDGLTREQVSAALDAQLKATLT